MSDRSKRLPLLIWSATAAYWIALFLLTHLPPSRLPRTRVTDTAAHFTSYAVLAALLLWSLHYTEASPRAAGWWVIAIGLVYAAADELLQIPVGRICSLSDWIADATGVITVVAVVVSVRAIRHAYRA